MYVIDSCVWISLFSDTDSQHNKAKELFSKIKPSSIVLLDYVYAEVLTVLRLKFPKKSCKLFVEMLKKININLERTSVNNYLIANSVFFSNKKLSFIDSIIVAYARINDSEIISFDKTIITLM